MPALTFFPHAPIPVHESKPKGGTAPRGEQRHLLSHPPGGRLPRKSSSSRVSRGPEFAVRYCNDSRCLLPPAALPRTRAEAAGRRASGNRPGYSGLRPWRDDAAR